MYSVEEKSQLQNNMAGPKAHGLMKSGGFEPPPPPPRNYTRSQSVMRRNDNEVLITMYILSLSVNNVLNLTFDKFKAFLE